MGSASRRTDFRALLSEEPPRSERASSSGEPAASSIEHVPIPPAGGAFVVDHDLRFLVAAGDALEVGGFQPADFIGKTIFEALDPELAARYEPLYREALAGGSFALDLESHGRTYLTRGAPLRDSAGRVHAALCLSYDITERRRAGAAGRPSDEVLADLLQNAPFGVFVVDDALRLLAYNQAVENALGKENPLVGLELADILPILGPEWPISDVRQRFRQTLATGDAYVAPAITDEACDVESSPSHDWRIQRFILPDGSWGVVCYFYDLRPIRRAERVLASAARRHAFLVQFTDALEPLTSARDVTRVAAERLGRYLGADRVVYVVVDDADEYGIAEVAWHADPKRRAIDRYRLLDYGADFVNALRRGETVVISDVRSDARTSMPPVVDAFARASVAAAVTVPLCKGQRLVAAMAICQTSVRHWSREAVELAEEIAERTWGALERARAEAALRQSQERLRDADRRKDEFIAILAHELRNPLAPIRTGLELLRLNGDSLGTLSGVRSMMERQLRQLVRLVDDLLDVSRITSGKIQLRRQRATITSLVSSALEAHQAAVQEAAIELVVDLPEQPVLLDVDPARVIQVISNLIHNAIKFTSRGGRIRLSAIHDTKHDSLALSVTDTGAGIPQEALPRLFELFAQGSTPPAEAQGGLGIGLALARRLIELHGGTLDATSDGPGRGSTFTIRLPALREAVAPLPVSTTRAASPSTARRVLVVDDNADAADTLALLIASRGGKPVVAYDGQTALSMARAQRPDLVLLDLGMPGMDGYETCRQLRASLGTHVTVVALTGLGQERDKQRTLLAGFDGHLIKPVALESLEEWLASAAGDQEWSPAKSG